MRASQSEIEAAVEALRAGDLVAFPTETVYGLGANASNPAAVRKIFAAKGRPANHPLIVHLDSIRYLHRWVRDVPEAGPEVAARLDEDRASLRWTQAEMLEEARAEDLLPPADDGDLYAGDAQQAGGSEIHGQARRHAKAARETAIRDALDFGRVLEVLVKDSLVGCHREWSPCDFGEARSRIDALADDVVHVHD